MDAEDLALLQVCPLDDVGVDGAEVEDEDRRVAPSVQGGEPVDREQRPGGDGEVELLADLADDARGGGLVPVDDAAGEVPSRL